MRILNYMITSVVAICLVSLFSFFIAREVLISLGTTQIRNGIQRLRNDQESGKYQAECVKKGSLFIEGQRLVTFQLRFISPSEYVLEAVCDQFSFAPLEIETGSLPPFVTKVPGSSGLIVGENGSGVLLSVFSAFDQELSSVFGRDIPLIDKNSGVYILDGKTYFAEEDTQIIPGPKTTCSGYGYTCCSSISEVGSGDHLKGSSDCDKTCFAQCSARPVLLSFASNPFVDLDSNVLKIKSNTLVDFAYVVSHEDDLEMLAVISFGDGESVSLNGSTGQTSHTYNCKSEQCRYTASITVTDELGVVSVPSQISTVSIVVTR